jgi:hypothetical protein
MGAPVGEGFYLEIEVFYNFKGRFFVYVRPFEVGEHKAQER